jgi:hypothetical protein
MIDCWNSFLFLNGCLGWCLLLMFRVEEETSGDDEQKINRLSDGCKVDGIL